MRTRTVIATATAAAALTLPAAAHADALALSAAADPVEEVSFVVTASGATSESTRVFATIKPAGPAGCGPTYRTDADGTNVMTWERAEGAYGVSGTAKVEEPGSYLICAWLQHRTADTTSTLKPPSL